MGLTTVSTTSVAEISVRATATVTVARTLSQSSHFGLTGPDLLRWGSETGTERGEGARPRAPSVVGPGGYYQSREVLLMAMRNTLMRWSGIR